MLLHVKTKHQDLVNDPNLNEDPTAPVPMELYGDADHTKLTSVSIEDSDLTLYLNETHVPVVEEDELSLDGDLHYCIKGSVIRYCKRLIFDFR